MAGDSAPKDIVARDLILRMNTDFPKIVDDELFPLLMRELLGMDKNVIRERAYKNENFKNFIKSPKFLVEFARMTGATNRLPPMEYIEKQVTNGVFHYKKVDYKIDLIDFVFDYSRHGFAERDFPFDANHGVKAIQDVGECVSPVPLRNIFVLENMNVPVCRFDPQIFCQAWLLALLRPKFVFRGLVACPKGDYGLIRFMVEVGNSKGACVKSEISVPFKNADETRLGRFIPFEIESPDYDFRPNHIFFFICVFYVNQKPMPNRGMRIANCTVQCVLPKMPNSLERIDCTDNLPQAGYDCPPHSCNFSIDNITDPPYLKDLKRSFFSVLDNSNKIRLAETKFAEKDIEKMFGGNLLGDSMDVDQIDDSGDKRKRTTLDEDEPVLKKAHVIQ